MNRSQLINKLWSLKEDVRRAREIKDASYLNKIQIFENFLVAHGPQIVDEMKDMFSDLAMWKLKVSKSKGTKIARKNRKECNKLSKEEKERLTNEAIKIISKSNEKV